MSAPRTTYRLHLSNPKTHLAELELILEGWSGIPVDLRMPVWTPGSYLIREFARHVQEFEPSSDGVPLRWAKTSKNTWRVYPEGRHRVQVRYRVYCNDFTVRTSHLDETHGFFNGANIFFEVADRDSVPYDLEILAPSHWKVSTSLPQLGLHHYQAPSFDVLADNPLEIGMHEVISFEAANTPHEIALYSEFATDGQRLAKDLVKIIESAAKLFGGLPYPRYLFILHLAPGLRGGLEHQLCNVSHGDPRVFESKELYQRLLELLSHEFFHAWNVKRLRPVAFRDYDYGKEVYTRLLWAFEGFTSYYELLLLSRGGLLGQDQFLASLSKELDDLCKTPGRKIQSLSQASFDTWIKYYRPDENSRNSSVSYYVKGCVVGCMLDLELRRRSEDRVSLDSVLRLMWKRFQESDELVAENGFETTISELLGTSLEEFFLRYVHGTDELPYNEFLGWVGLELLEHGPNGESTLGLTHETKEGRVKIKEVLLIGPAAAAGLSAGDELIALDGRRIEGRSLDEWIAARKPGSEARLHFFRREKLQEAIVRLAEAPPSKFELRPVAHPTLRQRKSFELWSGVRLRVHPHEAVQIEVVASEEECAQ